VILSVFVCGVVLGYTILQLENNQKTKLGSMIEPTNACTQPGNLWYQHRPFRFQFKGDPQYLYCGWRSTNNYLRFLVCGIGAVIWILPIIAIFKKVRPLLWIYFALAILVSIGFSASTVLDGNDLRISNSWCNDGLQGIVFQGSDQFSCAYTPYIILCLLDITAVVIWIGTTVIAFKYNRMSSGFGQGDQIGLVRNAVDP